MSLENKLKIAFFGTSEFSVIILDELKKAGFIPTLIVTNPDKPKGRDLILTPPPVKVWAEKNIKPPAVLRLVQPETLRDGVLLQELRKERWDLFIVASYGKIIPKEIIDLPLHMTLNVHPSLLPKFRGASPIQGAILADEKTTGVSIMILDEEMDHGPVIAQEMYKVQEWPTGTALEKTLAEKGGALLAHNIPVWIERNITAVPQEHHLASYTRKIHKTDGLIDMTEDPYLNFRKIQAYEGWPTAYFFHENTATPSDSASVEKTRIIIKKARYENNTLIIERVVPEGKNEMEYSEFVKRNAGTPSVAA